MAGKVDPKVIARYLAARNWRMQQQAQAAAGGTGGSTVRTVAPVAAFTGTPLSGTSPLSVTFTDSSTNTPTSWLWEKNDGSGWVNFAGTPTAQNPTEAFAVGTWSVRLTATNVTGSDTKTRSNYVASAWNPLVPAGLLAEYRFDSGSGTTLTDYSGNGNNGTLAGTGSTWGATGLTFNGSGRVTLPVPIASVKTVVFYGKQTALSPYNVVLSSDLAGGLMWGINNNTGNYRPDPFYWVGGVGEGLRAVEDTFQQGGGQGAAWVQNGTLDALYVQGWPCLNATVGAGGSNTAAVGRVGGLVIAANPGNGALNAFVGTMSGMLLYSTALSASEIAAAQTYLADRATTRGLAPYTSGYTGRNIWVCGDSESTTVAPATTNWPTVAGALYSPAWTPRGNGPNFGATPYVSQAVIGNTMARIVGGIRSRTVQAFGAAATRNLTVIFAGTNDALAGRTAAATFADLVTAVGYCTAAGGRVAVIPMMSRIGFDTFKNTYNALIAGYAWQTGVYLMSPSACPNLYPDGAYANTTYFNADGVHLTNTGVSELAAGIVPVVNSAA